MDLSMRHEERPQCMASVRAHIFRRSQVLKSGPLCMIPYRSLTQHIPCLRPVWPTVNRNTLLDETKLINNPV
jgi:hypothetical protein